jgi:hypothetical protein
MLASDTLNIGLKNSSRDRAETQSPLHNILVNLGILSLFIIATVFLFAVSKPTIFTAVGLEAYMVKRLVLAAFVMIIGLSFFPYAFRLFAVDMIIRRESSEMLECRALQKLNTFHTVNDSIGDSIKELEKLFKDKFYCVTDEMSRKLNIAKRLQQRVSDLTQEADYIMSQRFRSAQVRYSLVDALLSQKIVLKGQFNDNYIVSSEVEPLDPKDLEALMVNMCSLFDNYVRENRRESRRAA